MVVSEGDDRGVAAELGAHFRGVFDYLRDPVIRVAGEDIPISLSDRASRWARPRKLSPRRRRGWSARAAYDRSPDLLPRLGETMDEATVVGWLVAPGAAFRRGQPIVELETD